MVVNSIRVLCGAEALIKAELAAYAAGEAASILLEKAFEGTDLSWPLNLISFCQDITDIARLFSTKPNYYGEFFNYFAFDSKYQVFIKLSNGVTCEMKDISQTLNVL